MPRKTLRGRGNASSSSAAPPKPNNLEELKRYRVSRGVVLELLAQLKVIFSKLKNIGRDLDRLTADEKEGEKAKDFIHDLTVAANDAGPLLTSMIFSTGVPELHSNTDIPSINMFIERYNEMISPAKSAITRLEGIISNIHEFLGRSEHKKHMEKIRGHIEYGPGGSEYMKALERAVASGMKAGRRRRRTRKHRRRH
jgi:hypothetical protein